MRVPRDVPCCLAPPQKKHRGMVVARRILRRSGAAASKDQDSGEAELVVGTISRTHVRNNLGARVFILIWTAILLLPEDGLLDMQVDCAALPLARLLATPSRHSSSACA